MTSTWRKSSHSELTACVEVAFRPRCDTGSCVDVSYTSRCDNVSCVEVGHADGTVLVRDSKRPDMDPVSFTPDTWRRLLERVKNSDEINWDGVFFPLVFDQGELDAFIKGALDGQFDLAVPVSWAEAVAVSKQGSGGCLVGCDEGWCQE